MSPFRPSAAMALLVLLLACDGCEERLRIDSAARDQGRSGGVDTAVETAANQRPDPYLLSLAGRLDVTNRYLSAVRISAEFNEHESTACGGALIGRHLVLTAGHCVCQQRKVLSEAGGTQSLIDGSACAKTATVETRTYEMEDRLGQEASSYGDFSSGTVRPHPELRILLDAQGQVVSSHADLALVFLDKPIGKEFEPFPLAEEELQLGEAVIIVGSGYDEVARYDDRGRRFSRNKVTQALPSGGGRMRIEQPDGHHYRGDSGGPCLREGPQGPVLVGVSSRNLGMGAALTSIHGYLDWLRQELEDAKSPAAREKTR